MVLLLDIGNTRSHLGLADRQAARPHASFLTSCWFKRELPLVLRTLLERPTQRGKGMEAVVICSVVPEATRAAQRLLRDRLNAPWLELNGRSARQVIEIDYPRPQTVGPDRLANVIAARHRYGAPCLAVDFGTAVTFDAVDRRGHFVGGMIAPGLGLMTDYLHDRTALLPVIRLQPVRHYLGRSTRQAMLAGAVHGFRGLVRELVSGLKRELGAARLPVIATGGDALRVAGELPEFTAVEPNLTLEGLRLFWLGRGGAQPNAC
jgi:type III pantothenate kinase